MLFFLEFEVVILEKFAVLRDSTMELTEHKTVKRRFVLKLKTEEFFKT